MKWKITQINKKLYEIIRKYKVISSAEKQKRKWKVLNKKLKVVLGIVVVYILLTIVCVFVLEPEDIGYSKEEAGITTEKTE